MGFVFNGLLAGLEVDFLVLLSGIKVDWQAIGGWLWRLALEVEMKWLKLN